MRVTPFDESERRKWTGQADAYASSFAKVCAYTVPSLLDAAGVQEGTRILDAGTGPGTVAVAACQRRAKVTAVDAEASMVTLAARAAPAADVGLAALPSLPFADDEFDAVVCNFVLNHVGRPQDALSELRRVTRPGGLIAATIWAVPSASGQSLLGRAVEAAGVARPVNLLAIDAENDFPRTEQGFAKLLDSVGLLEVSVDVLAWNHRTTPEEWWQGPAAGVATIGKIVTSQPPAIVAGIKGHYYSLCEEFVDPSGVLALPHVALMARGRV